MSEIYGRDLDLNLLRVFVVVASAGSVTQAAAQLYLTQPAISAAMRRLRQAVGAPLFARSGRGLVLTQRGEQLYATVRPHLSAMIEAALAPPQFDPRTSDRTVRVGLSDAVEGWVLPPLLRAFEQAAPHMRLISLPVQFRTVYDALARRDVECAVTVADELPSTIRRRALFQGAFVCLYDPRKLRLKGRLSEQAYFALDHVIVSYNGDLRGVVEDELHKQRNVRLSVSGFSQLGAVVSGSRLLATVPEVVARYVCRAHPELKTTPLPFHIEGSPSELLWPAVLTDEPACAFVREQIVKVCAATFARRGA
jgi:LysR family transcriptional activator of mexEF-oprN operon